MEDINDKRLPDANNPDIFSIAYLSFLENENLDAECKLVYLHLKARAGKEGILWFKKTQLWTTLGLKERKYYTILKKLSDLNYIRQFARYKKKNGARMSNVIVINSIDPYTGLPITPDNVDNILEYVSHTVNTYVRNVITRQAAVNGTNEKFEGYVIRELPKKGKKKESENEDIHNIHSIHTQLQKTQLGSEGVNANSAGGVNAKNAVTPTAKNAITPLHETQLRVTADSAELYNINYIDNINKDNINIDKEKGEDNNISSPNDTHNDFQNLNELVMNTIKSNMTTVSFDTWIKTTLNNAYIENDTIYILCPNRFTKEIIESKYNDIIEKSYRAVGITFNKIIYYCEE